MTIALRRRVMVTTLLVWLAVVAIFESARVWLSVAGPPTTEEYVRHLDFQVFASVYLVATLWLPLLGLVLLLEYGVLWFLNRRLTSACSRRPSAAADAER